jgi:nicotinate dehydrogenase subunit A
MTPPVELTVNGVPRQVDAPPDTSLLDVLRGDLGLKGARFGCGMGLCGACFVLVEGTAVPACDTPLWSVEGKVVTTVEGLADGGRLHPVQQAVLDEQAGQCAFCVPGMVVSAAALLAEQSRPDEATVAAALDRHLCRCGIQRRMIAAVLRAGRDAGDGAP